MADDLFDRFRCLIDDLQSRSDRHFQFDAHFAGFAERQIEFVLDGKHVGRAADRVGVEHCVDVLKHDVDQIRQRPGGIEAETRQAITNALHAQTAETLRKVLLSRNGIVILEVPYQVD